MTTYDLYKTLESKYPKVYGRKVRGEPYSMFGFEIERGWFHPMDALGRKLSELTYIPDIVQIKQKYGQLRLYYDYYYVDPESPPTNFDPKKYDEDCTQADQLIINAELACDNLCEWCGGEGEIRPGGWIYTLCSLCNQIKFKPGNTEEIPWRGAPLPEIGDAK